MKTNTRTRMNSGHLNYLKTAICILLVGGILLMSSGAYANWPFPDNRVAVSKPVINNLKPEIPRPATTHLPGKQDINAGKSLSFIENKGQVTDQHSMPRHDIQYSLAAASGLNIFIGNGAIHYQFSKRDNTELLEHNQDPKSKFTNLATDGQLPTSEKITYSMYRMDVELVGANKNAHIVTDEKTGYYENYFTPGTGENGATAHAYNRITYKNVYPHIDWVLYTTTGQLKHEFVVHKGGRVSDIKLKYGGATSLKLDNIGALTASTPQGNITEQAPYTYQKDGKKITSSFKLNGDVLSYETGDYSGELVIDPSLAWATYYGGDESSGNDISNDVVVDNAGNVYIVGYTHSTSSIATVGAHDATYGGSSNHDAYLVKFNNTGIRQWATYYGGSGSEQAQSVAVDASGNIYMGGHTSSSTNIATSGAHDETFSAGNDAFLVKFNGAGVRQWATYYGGSGGEVSPSVATDGGGNVYIAGQTSSTSDIATAGAHDITLGGLYDAYLVKFNSSGIRQWATYYGGEGVDRGYSIAVDGASNVIMTGVTESTADLATVGAHDVTRGGTSDAFVVKFNGAGVRQWASYYGGSSSDWGTKLAVDGSGNIFLTGFTQSSTEIATTASHDETLGGSQDAFLVKFNSSGVRQWATYYGGSNTETGWSLKTDGDGSVWVCGSTQSSADIATTGSYDETLGGSQDAFLVEFNTVGIRQWSTYFGGSGSEVGNSLTTDLDGNVWMVGHTSSSTNIATSGAHDETLGGSQDAFLAKFAADPAPASITGVFSVCVGATTTLANATTGGTWSSASPSTATIGSTGIVTGVAAGTAVISYTVAGGSATNVVTVNPLPNAGTITGLSSVNAGSTITLSNATTGGTWSSSNTSVATVGTGGVVTGVAVGTVSISYTVTSSCGSASVIHMITVSPSIESSCTDWVTTGGDWVSGVNSVYSSIAIDGSNVPYVAYQDGANSNKATVKKYNGSSWETVGIAGFSAGVANYISLAIDGSGVPYVAYRDGSNSNKTTVMKFNGGSWAVVGSAGFSAGAAHFVSLAINASGVPYVAYKDGANSDKVTVMKYNGSSWEVVGSAGFSAGSIFYTSLAIDGSGIPFVAYRDEANSGKATVMKYNGSSWGMVGIAGFSVGSINYPSLVMDGSGMPYLAYRDDGNSHKATVMKFNGSIWQTVGSAGFSTGPIDYISLALNASGTPYVVYSDGGYSWYIGKATAMKFNGSSWELIGRAGFSSGHVSYTSIAINGSGTPYVVYHDGANSNKAIVMQIGTYTLPAITGVATTCIGANTTLSNTTTGGTWSSGNETVATIGSTGIVSGVAAGTATISYTISTGCVAIAVVTVSPLSTIISGPASVCVGSAITLTGGSPYGIWSSNITYVASVDSNTGLVMGVSGGAVEIRYTLVSGCYGTKVVNVNPVEPIKIINTIAGNGIIGTGSDGGMATTSSVMYPQGITFDRAGNLYVASQSGGRVRKITPAGIISTVAGNGSGYSGDGGPATAAGLSNPTSVAVDTFGNLYVACVGEHRIRKISVTGIISTFAGTGTAGFSGDGGPASAANLNQPWHITIDNIGNLYVATHNSRVRKISTSGIISTFAGLGGGAYSGDGGPATAAALLGPNMITADNAGNIYISEHGGNRVRKVNADGIISTVAGNGIAGFSGDGGPASASKIYYPQGLAVDSSGNLYISDAGNHRIRKVSPLGIITTVVGTGIAGFNGDGGQPANANLYYPNEIIFDTLGNMYIADESNHRIRKVRSTTVSLTGTLNLCVASTVSLTPSVLGGTWTSSDPAVAVVGSSGVVTGIATGTAVITYITSAPCTSNSATAIVTVNPAPNAGVISGLSSICGGNSIVLSSSGTAGSWSSSNSTVAVVGSTGIVIGVSSGSAIISYVVTGSCAPSVATKTITVTGPSVNTITGASSVCVGSTASVNNTTSGGTWSSSNTAVATISPSRVITGVSAGTATISYTVTSGSCSSSATRIITVNPLANAGTLSGPPNLCIGSSITLTTTGTGGTWSSDGSYYATVSTAGVVTGVNMGTANIRYSATNSCGTVHAIKSVTVDGMPPGTLSGPNNIDVGSSTTFTPTVTGGTWSSSNTSVATVDSAGLITGLSNGTTIITYSVTNTCGSGTVTKSLSVLSVISSPCAQWTATSKGLGLSEQGGGTNTVIAMDSSGVPYIMYIGDKINIKKHNGNEFVSIGGPFESMGYPANADMTVSNSGIPYISFTDDLNDYKVSVIKFNGTSWEHVGSPGISTGSAFQSAIITDDAGLPCISYPDDANGGKATVMKFNGETWIPVGAEGFSAGSVYYTSLVADSSGNLYIAYTDSDSGYVVKKFDGSIWQTISSSDFTSVYPVGIRSLALDNNGAPNVLIYNGSGMSVMKYHDGSWESVGGSDFYSGYADKATISVGKNGVPFVVFQPMGSAFLNVMQYTSGSWMPVGGDVTLSGTETPSIGIDNDGIPYVVSREHRFSDQVIVRKFVDSNWIIVPGNQHFGVGSVYNYSMAIDSSNTQYVAYIDNGVPVFMDEPKGLVIKYNGTTWDTLGSVNFGIDFSLGYGGGYTGTPMQIAVESNGTPYLAYIDALADNKATVLKFNGTVWEVLGSAGFTAGHPAEISFEIDKNGIPYLAYTDNDNSQKVTVEKYNGSDWVIVGTSGFTSSYVSTMTMTIDSAGSPLIAFNDNDYSGKATVMKFDGASWNVLGVPGFSSGYVYGIQAFIQIKTYNGMPYVVYPDGAYDGRVCVKKFNGSAWESVGPEGFSITETPHPCIAFDNTGYPIVSYGTYSWPQYSTVKKFNGTDWVTIDMGGVKIQSNSLLTGSDGIPYVIGMGQNYNGNPLLVKYDNAQAPITGTLALCEAATTTLSNTTAGGSWSSSNVSVATVSSTGVVSGISAGTAVISYDLGACNTTVVVTVNALPSAGTITGVTSVCAGSSTTLSNTTGGGSWSSSNTSVAAVGSTGFVNGVAAGTTTISYSVTNGCGTVSATKVITVNTTPSVGTISGASLVCAGSTITLVTPTTGGSWTSSASGIANVNSSGLVTGVAVGTAVISYTVSNECGTASALRIVSVSPLPVAATIAGASSVNAGASITLSNATTGGTWSSSNSDVASVNSSGVVNGIATGTTTISYNVTNSCGSVAATKIVTVNAVLETSITGALTVCQGSTTTLSNATSGGSWSSSNTAVATIGSTGIVAGTSAGTSVVSYTISGTSVTAIVTVNPLPNAGTITGSSTVCTGTTLTLFNSTTGGSWSSSTDGATVGSTGVVTGVAAGSATISYAVTNECGISVATKDIAVLFMPDAGTITGTASLCVEATTTLSNTTTGGTWSSGYPAVATVDASGLVTGVGAGSASISYRMTNSCGTAYASFPITVISVPALSAISGTATVCQAATTTLGNTISGGTWSSSNTAVATIATPAVGVVTGVTTGTSTISYTASNTCGTSVVSRVVTVNSCARPGVTVGTDRNNSVFTVSPNPTTGAINLTTDVAGKVVIYTIDGKELEQYEAKAGTTSISLPAGIASGVYMLRFNGADGSSRMVRLIYQQ